MMNPIGTELTVVLNVVTAGLLAAVVVVAVTVKYTRLSTTLSIAVWLLRTLILGLERTRTSPNVSSSLSVAARLRPGEAYPATKLLMLFWPKLNGKPVDCCWNVNPDVAPAGRKRLQSMP